MCWSAEVSLQSFLLGFFAVGVGAFNHMSISTLFFCLTIVLMQFVEYIVWSNYHDEKINNTASIFAAYLLWLQPIASIFTVTNTTLKIALLSSYMLITWIGQMISTQKKYSMKQSKNGHLEWTWLTKEPETYISLAIYFFYLFVPLLLGKNLELLALAFLTLSISLYTFWKDNTWGSMWCWFVNGIVLLVVGKSLFT